MVGAGEVVGTVDLAANLPDWLGSAGGLWITAPSEKVGKVGSAVLGGKKRFHANHSQPTRGAASLS